MTKLLKQNARLKASGLSTFLYLLIFERLAKGQARPTDLAFYCSVTPAALTGLSDALEKKGLLVRTRANLDRRSVSLNLTDSGHVLHHTLTNYTDDLEIIPTA